MLIVTRHENAEADDQMCYCTTINSAGITQPSLIFKKFWYFWELNYKTCSCRRRSVSLGLKNLGWGPSLQSHFFKTKEDTFLHQLIQVHLCNNLAVVLNFGFEMNSPHYNTYILVWHMSEQITPTDLWNSLIYNTIFIMAIKETCLMIN